MTAISFCIFAMCGGVVSFLAPTWSCQVITPSAQLIVEEQNATWVEGNDTSVVESLAKFHRVQGVSETSDLALLVGPGNFSILKRMDDGECFSQIVACPDRRVTYSFWLKVLKWRESGNQFIFQTAIFVVQTGLIVHTWDATPDDVRIYFNGDGYDYEYFVKRTVFTQWAFLAIVIDANARTMKVFVNGTEQPDSADISSRVRSQSGRWISIGQNTQTPDYHIAGIKVHFTNLSQTDLQEMFKSVTGEARVNATGSTHTTEAEVTTASDNNTVTVTNTMPTNTNSSTRTTAASPGVSSSSSTKSSSLTTATMSTESRNHTTVASSGLSSATKSFAMTTAIMSATPQTQTTAVSSGLSSTKSSALTTAIMSMESRNETTVASSGLSSATKSSALTTAIMGTASRTQTTTASSGQSSAPKSLATTSAIIRTTSQTQSTAASLGLTSTTKSSSLTSDLMSTESETQPTTASSTQTSSSNLSKFSSWRAIGCMVGAVLFYNLCQV